MRYLAIVYMAALSAAQGEVSPLDTFSSLAEAQAFATECPTGFSPAPDNVCEMNDTQIGAEYIVRIVLILMLLLVFPLSSKLLERVLAKRVKKFHGAYVALNTKFQGAISKKITPGGEQTRRSSVTEQKGKTAFDYKRERVNFEFENLGLEVPTPKGPKTVLKGVSGKINSGTLVAVMGPSGCGKTTFMNVLCGRAFYGKPTSGSVVKINGGKDEIMNYRNKIGFVPQDDVVHDTLTVQENLWYSSRLRMPASATDAERDAIVEDSLNLLQIDHIRHSVVGSVEKRGISGGQRKRVNIGLELTCDPVVLFLDEPTSGLDSTSSEVVLSALKDMARSGMTVVTVIHQPRYSIYEQFG
jgi:ABC-type multidrug transport system ATPase subunit